MEFIYKLVSLCQLNKIMSPFAAKLKCAFSSKSVLWIVNHGELSLIKILASQKVDLKRLDEAIDDKSSNRCVSRA